MEGSGKNKGAAQHGRLIPCCPGELESKAPPACDVPTFLPGWSVKPLPAAEAPRGSLQLLVLHCFKLDLLCLQGADGNLIHSSQLRSWACI